MGQLLVRNVDENIIERLKNAPGSTVPPAKKNTGVFCAKPWPRHENEK
jgi:hypothetical protein